MSIMPLRSRSPVAPNTTSPITWKLEISGTALACVTRKRMRAVSTEFVEHVDPLVAQRGAGDDRLIRAVDPGVDRVAADPLAQRDVLLHDEAVDIADATQVELERAGGLAVVHRPIGVGVAVDRVRRTEQGALLPRTLLAVIDKLGRHELAVEECVALLLECHQGVDVFVRRFCPV